MNSKPYTPRYLAPSLGLFLRKIAIDYVRYGYIHYALITIPERKSTPEELSRIDEKILRDYSITYHRTTRAKRKAEGVARIAYVRYKRWLFVLGTDGTPPTDHWERTKTFDIREKPLLFCGYHIYLGGQVSISRRRFTNLIKFLSGIALHNERKVGAAFRGVSHSIHFPKVVQQKMKLLNIINNRRKKAGLSRISWRPPHSKHWIPTSKKQKF